MTYKSWYSTHEDRGDFATGGLITADVAVEIGRELDDVSCGIAPSWSFHMPNAQIQTSGPLDPNVLKILTGEKVEDDPVNHPKHYTSHPSGVEVITITEHMGFCLGNVIKYVLRADLKNDALEDLKKAAWYLNREIEKRENEKLNRIEADVYGKPKFSISANVGSLNLVSGPGGGHG